MFDLSVMSNGQEVNNSLRVRILPRIQCADGFSLSVQASKYNYCSPRETLDNLNDYTSFEVGYPSHEDSLITPFAEYKDRPLESVYGFVPTEIVRALIKKHGGFKIN